MELTVAGIALRVVLVVLIALILAMVCVTLVLCLFQNRLLYMTIVPFESRYPHNNSAEFRSPASQGLDYEDLRIRTPDGTKLHGWLVKSNSPELARTVVFYHENAENLGYRVKFFREYVRLTQSNIVIFAYRGYSYSEGKPSESGLKEDAIAILDFVTKQLPGIDHSRVFLHGKSLGGAVTTYAATHATPRQIRGAILENTFTSFSDVVESILRKVCLGFFSPILKAILTNYWRSIDIIDQIRVPVLFIKSRKDRLIPTSQMDGLQEKFELAGGVCRQFVIPEGTHDDTWVMNKSAYFKQLNKFFQDCQINH